MSLDKGGVPIHELPFNEHYSILIRELISAIEKKQLDRANSLISDLKNLISDEISFVEYDRMYDERIYPGLSQIEDFNGNPVEEWQEKLPFLQKFISSSNQADQRAETETAVKFKADDRVEDVDSTDEPEVVDTMISEAIEAVESERDVLELVDTDGVDYEVWHKDLIRVRKEIVRRIKAGEVDADLAAKAFLIVEQIREAQFIYGENMTFLADDINRLANEILDRLAGDSSLEGKEDHQSFIDLSNYAQAVFEQLQNDSFDPRRVVDPDIFKVQNNESGSTYREVLEKRLEKARGFISIYEPGKATNTTDIDYFYKLQDQYIIPAQEVLVAVESRINWLVDEALTDWLEEIRNSAVHPDVAFVGSELMRGIPPRPYSGDNPSRRLARIDNDADAETPYSRALVDLEALRSEIDSQDPNRQAKINFIDGMVKDLEAYVSKLREMIEEDENSAEVLAWEISVQEFEDTIQEILSLPATIDIVAERDKVIDLEVKLISLYEALLGSGALNLETENGDVRGNIVRLVGNDQKSGRYIRAKEKILKLVAPIHEEENHPSNLSWEELTKIIESNNIDVYDHATMAKSSADKYDRQVYLAFHGRKGALVREDFATEKEYLQKEQERIDAVAWIVLSKIESINQNEGQIPTCTRSDLFPMLNARQMHRNIILKAITYHPEHGNLMREMLDQVILEVSKRSGSEISYNDLTSSGRGRDQINRYMRKHFYDRAITTLYQDLSEDERKKKIERFFDLANVTYNLFDLLTISFAELQTQTQTGAHQRLKGGKSFSQKNYVSVTRPDAAWVHNTQRYDSPSHVSAWWSMYMKRIPASWGREGENSEGLTYHQLLHEQQHEVLMFQDCFYDASLFSGKNGIEPSSLFDPIFPDTRTFLMLSDKWRGTTELLEFGNSVWGLNDKGEYVRLGRKGETIKRNGKDVKLYQSIGLTELYEDVAMAGWEEVLKLVFGDLPPQISEHQILKSSNTGGDNPNLGFLDIMINKGCGMGKMFPGRHMEAIAPLFTHYIMRIFSRYRATGHYREHTFKQVIKKIQSAAQSKGGLGGHQDVAAQVIRNISSPKFQNMSDQQILGLSYEKFTMSDSLRSGVVKRRDERIRWVATSFVEGGKKTPAFKGALGGSITSILSVLSKFSQHDQQKFWRMVEGKEKLPDPEINRDQSPFKSVDEGH